MADEPRRITDFLNKLNDDREFRKKWQDTEKDEDRRKLMKHLPKEEQDAMLDKTGDAALAIVKRMVPNVFVFRFIK